MQFLPFKIFNLFLTRKLKCTAYHKRVYEENVYYTLSGLHKFAVFRQIYTKKYEIGINNYHHGPL